MIKYIIAISVLLSIACNTNDKKFLTEEEVSGYTIKDSTSIYESAKAYQSELNSEYKDPKTSPLKDKDRKDFEGLDFFEIDTTYAVVAKFTRTPDELSFYMQTTTDRTPEYKKYGYVTFLLKGKEFVLNVYQSQQLKNTPQYKNYLFIPFLDDTNGTLTYGGGRYLDTNIPEGNTIPLDFNKAYNPYCAYNKKYSCPVVPQENRVNMAINAGVKKFK